MFRKISPYAQINLPSVKYPLWFSSNKLSEQQSQGNFEHTMTTTYVSNLNVLHNYNHDVSGVYKETERTKWRKNKISYKWRPEKPVTVALCAIKLVF